MLTALQMREKVQRQRALEELPSEVWLKVEEAFYHAAKDLKDFTVTLELSSSWVPYMTGIVNRFQGLGYVANASIAKTPGGPVYLRISF